MESRAVQVVWLTIVCLLFAWPILGWLLRQRERPFLRSWHPRHRRSGYPDDCPLCQEARLATQPDAVADKQTVEPWSRSKSRRGRKKTLDTEGVACPNPECKYVGITDNTVHAIVGDGHRGVTDDIRYWRCQCCQKRFSSRLGTPLYRLKTPPKRVAEAMTAFAEGAKQMYPRRTASLGTMNGHCATGCGKGDSTRSAFRNGYCTICSAATCNWTNS